MSFADKYLSRQNKFHFYEAPLLTNTTHIVVVIPCYNEPYLANTINSLLLCEKPNENVAVVIVVNDSDLASSEELEQNQYSLREIEKFKEQMPHWLSLHAIYAKMLPNKNAGVGWARKIGMDWAITHFNRYNNEKGIIISLDADTLVEKNYFNSISNFYKTNPNSIGATLYFEHPIPEGKLGKAITLYELYMRYYKNALQYIGFPYPIYTVGSCFTLRAEAYVQQGGMNRRKAGEDFYFLQKLLPLGSLGEIKSTVVQPSSRLSTRVPFGTGSSLNQYIEGTMELEKTYSFDSFLILKTFFDNIESYYYNHQTLSANRLGSNQIFISFIIEINFCDELKELISNCSSIEVYRKRFFHLFNAFKILKWLNHCMANGYNKNGILEESKKLLVMKDIKYSSLEKDANKMLNLFRYLDKTT